MCVAMTQHPFLRHCVHCFLSEYTKTQALTRAGQGCSGSRIGGGACCCVPLDCGRCHRYGLRVKGHVDPDPHCVLPSFWLLLSSGLYFCSRRMNKMWSKMVE